MKVRQLLQPRSLQPGPFGFNEGFIGLMVNEPIASIRFSPRTLPFVIDDLHFKVPEPSAIALAVLVVSILFARRRKSIDYSRV